jgi:hypothetical protein
MSRYSVAMDNVVADELRDQLVRDDGQEDVCLATYSPSTGAQRLTAVVASVNRPVLGDRRVHGNATFTGDYVVRVGELARQRGEGMIILHSHPGAMGWQRMSSEDAESEASYAYLVHELTGLPLVGMTLATADEGWSARFWTPAGSPTWAESVRAISAQYKVTWNDALRPTPSEQRSQTRTVSAWGPRMQADLARLRVLVVGVGSVGLDVAQRLTASGLQHVGVMDFDSVEEVNLDRMIGATRADVRLHRSKTAVAARLMREAATALNPQITQHDLSICQPDGLQAALDYDLIFSCVDRPWARGVLNTVAYTDLIPVIDGGIAIDAFSDGDGMRSATWRTHTLRPGRPCLICNGQVTSSQISVDRSGALDDPSYVEGADPNVEAMRGAPNVALLAGSVSASMLAQFVSFFVAPGGEGDPGPLQYHLVGHSLEHLSTAVTPACLYETRRKGDRGRLPLVGVHQRAIDEIARRGHARARFQNRLAELADRIGGGLGGR